MKPSVFLLTLLLAFPVWAGIPATPVMTLYQFNGDTEIPYYRVKGFTKKGPGAPAGNLAQGTSLIPCLVVRNGKALTDSSGTPYVGFEVVVDARTATPASAEKLEAAWAAREAKIVPNHHCDSDVEHVINVRRLMARQKRPFFDPPAAAPEPEPDRRASELDTIVRAFHNSDQCADANRKLTGRRGALEQAWNRFMGQGKGRWPDQSLARAKHLDYVMRTALYEGHIGRGCSAYGACERNVIVLSIRNRARGQCLAYQGCRFPGDFQGVSSSVSQYNIWDEYLTQISGLTACFLRDDLSATAPYTKLQSMYAQSVGDAEKILYGSDADLLDLFSGNTAADLQSLRHYYHAPAMGKCYPDHDRVEYISGAVARKGDDFALIANTRIKVDGRTGGGYYFRDFVVDETPERDVVEVVDRYPGFVIDGRKVGFGKPSRCHPYGVPRGCRFDEIGRYRRTPPWLTAGKPLELTCRIADRGEQCQDEPRTRTAKVGGLCDVEMRPVTGVR
jgi:hypothetical protein